MSGRLPPKEFNPTVFQDHLGGERWRLRVSCFGREVARLDFDVAARPRRRWTPVIRRWVAAVVGREKRKWLAGQEAEAVR